MSGLVLQREVFTPALYAEALPLLERHWREIAQYEDIPLEGDVDRYVGIESAGMLRVFTVRRDGELIAYACFFVAPNGHYKGSLQAVEDILYVSPDARGGLIGRRLVRYVDKALAAEGVQVASHHVKLKHPALGMLLANEGYEPIETIYAKRLDRAGA